MTLQKCWLTFLLLACTAVQANQLEGVRAWPSPDNTRVVLDLTAQPNYAFHYLSKPERLVIDIESTQSKVNLQKISNDGPLIKNIRESGSDKKGTYRLVIDLNQASAAKIFTLPPAQPYGHRLVIDLPHEAPAIVVTPTPAATITFTPPVGRNVIVAIDAGHGGDDPGALGQFSYEKKITLEIAKRLQDRINKQNGMSAFLIRTGDYYVNLNKRSELAFKGKADFLVSIHADGFTSSQPSGASVWILSDRRANSEMGRRMEKHEVHSELLGGKGEATEVASSVPFLNKVFFDMSKSNSMQVGSDVGNLVVKELKKITKLHKVKPVGASLAVLKSPYIPSILVEAGFITNHREEKLLNQASYQNKVAEAVFKGIYKHFKESPPHDTLFAQKKRVIKHTVRSGESLSMLAERYSVSSSDLKLHNRLKSNTLNIGQVLKIPPDYLLVVKRDPVAVVPVLPPDPVVNIHKVKSGESLSVIAKRYGTSTDTLKNYNKLRSTSLAIGQKIMIPSDTVALQTATRQVKPAQHKVQRGESLSVIAQQYDTTTEALKTYNKLRSTQLSIGQVIKIPGDTSLVSEVKSEIVIVIASSKLDRQPVIHKVNSGESLSVIALQYDTTTEALKTYNKLRSTELAIGQVINIPTNNSDFAALKSEIASANRSINTEPIKHKVKSGESLSVIAQQYETTTESLKAYNKLRSTQLSIGQVIKIPTNNSLVSELKPEVAISPIMVNSDPVVHQVKSGESLSVIASRYGKTANSLKTYNNLRSTSLAIGQKITIPVDEMASDNISSNNTKVTKSALSKESVHQVRSGESLSVIAANYNTTSQVLKVHNKLRSTVLAVGQKIKIPAGADNLTTHKVKSGESLSVIAARYGTTASEIKSINNLRSSSLAIGQLLTIPTT